MAGKDAAPGPHTTLLRKVLRRLHERANVTLVSDSTGAKLNGRDALLRALVLRRLLRRELAADERNVGVLLPPTVAGVVTNLALALDKRVAVNLNYSLTPELIRHSIKEAGVHHAVTSRAFLERMPVDLAPAEAIVLEDLGKRATMQDKALAAAGAYLPIPLLERWLGITKIPAESPMAIIFTSGSAGWPKGVVLPWRSIEANVGMVDALLHLRADDVMLGVLPFFHSFGFTITLWTPLVRGIGAVYHTNPLEGRIVGRLIKERKATILLGTPTFLRAYQQRLSKEDFATVELVASGSERLPAPVADAFEEKFGVRPFQGYGATEMGPIVSCNVPPNRALDHSGDGLREGTVGRPALGVRIEVRDPETGQPLGANQRGVLWATGPGVMLGYLNQPELTAQAVMDGWYNTGDVVEVDEDGFIRIVGRASRFAKIGGEQVPFAAVEEALAPLVGATEEGVPRAVVTAVPHEATGERLVVIHTALEQTPDELVKALASGGLPRLYTPSQKDFYQVEALPLLGIGKVDLKGVDAIALERAVRLSKVNA
jgi:acyl-[acyl-carrier-protein]-phospholipid O-acyltransferase/long-chain-fatty-acid--[acyl-carrier-protein] ligase